MRRIIIAIAFICMYINTITAQKWEDIDNISTEYFNSAQYSLAKEYADKALKKAEIEFGKNSPEYASSLLSLGMISHKLQNLDSAENYYSSALKIYKSTGKQFGYAKTLIYLGSLYKELNKYDDAERFYLESKGMFENAGDTSSFEYYILLNNIANVYAETGRQNPALDYYLIIEKNIDKIAPNNHSSFYTNVGLLYNEMGKLNDAQKYYKKAIKSGKDNNGDYSFALNNLALSYVHQDNSRDLEAISLIEEALDLEKKLYNADITQHFSFCICDNLALIYERSGNYQKAEKLTVEGNKMLRNKIIHYFSFLSDNERELNLQNFIQKTDMFQSFYCRNVEKNPGLAGYAYNNALMTKRLMLSHSQRLKNAVLSSGDAKKIETLNNLENLSRESLELLSLPPTATVQKQIQTLQTDIDQLQKQLIRNLKDNIKFDEHIDVDWRDVKKKLNKGEVAIEFIYFENFSEEYLDWSDDYLYYALIIKPEFEYPLLIPLFNERELDKAEDIMINIINARASVSRNSIKDLKSLYKLIWEPVSRYLKQGETLYYSSSSYLHHIPFSALIDESGSYLYEKYNLRQLSSTREIMNRDEAPNTLHKSISIFGDIDYDAKIGDLVSQAKSYVQHHPFYLNNNEYIRLRTFDKLFDVKFEIENISQIFLTNGFIVDKYRGHNASEEAIYNLQNKKHEILHLATHGYYSRISDDKKLGRLIDSGLVLAGANTNMTGIGDKINANINDGILTTYEISGLDLSNTKLVVLSACNTGLGYIDWDQSIWGIPRAFKMAGVSSMILTLWEVNDKATSLFMSKFYEEWLVTKSRHEAFNSAQTYIRSMNEYKEPFHWAAFVMID